MNISESTQITGTVSLKRGHLAQCLADKNRHEPPQYDYFGPRVTRGRILLHTVNGDVLATFRTKYGWVTDIELLEVS